MDDILILAPTRWRLRRAVKAVNQTLGALSLEKHPDKTFIGRIERGFDFLGYHFSPAGLTLAKETVANFIEKASRLYEQKRSPALAATALEMYVRRWVRWTTSGRIDLVDHRVVCHRWVMPSREWLENTRSLYAINTPLISSTRAHNAPSYYRPACASKFLRMPPRNTIHIHVVNCFGRHKRPK
jgi:hypothetical protein